MGGFVDGWFSGSMGGVRSTHPSTHTPTPHPWVGVSLQIINLQTGLNYLDSVNNF